MPSGGGGHQAPPVTNLGDSINGAELGRASEECEILLWGMAQSGHFVSAEELYTVAKAHKIALELTKLANEKLSQVGYGV